MSKNGGLGSKRIGSMTSKGMGKCDAGTRAEQCGNARGLGKGRGERMDTTKEKTLLIQPDHIAALQEQLTTLEVDLKKIKEKLINLKID